MSPLATSLTLLHAVNEGFGGGISEMDKESKKTWCVSRGLPSDLVDGGHITFTPSQDHEVLKASFSYEKDAGGSVSAWNMVLIGVHLKRMVDLTVSLHLILSTTPTQPHEFVNQ